MPIGLISCFGVQSNLLFIVLDDLRPDFTIYGNKNSLTPNFERLAKNSMSFEHANAQISASDPSKMSLFTGLRPDTTNIYNDFQPQNLPQLILPTLLSRLGYKTVEIGTVFPSNGILNENIWDAQFSALKSPSNVEGKGKNAVMHDKQSTEADYPDYQYASHVIEAIKGFKQSKDLFLIAVSFDLKVASHKLKDHFNENQIKSAKQMWFLSDAERRFPNTTSMYGFECCLDREFHYTKSAPTSWYHNSSSPHRPERFRLQDLQKTIPEVGCKLCTISFLAFISILQAS